MPVTGALVSGGIGLVGSIGNLIGGSSQKSKGEKLLKSLKDPTYTIPQEFYQNRDMARQMAQVGMPQQQYNNQVNAINQNQAASLSALQRSANPGAAIAAVTGRGDAATGNLNAEDATARANNQRYAIQQNSALAGQELAKQQNDVFDTYTRKYNEAQALIGAGTQNKNNAFNSISQLGALGVQAAMGMGKIPGGSETMGQMNGYTPLSATAPSYNTGGYYGTIPNYPY